MIEYFACCGIESFLGNGNLVDINISNIGVLLTLSISLATAYLAYQCNKKEGLIFKIAMTTIGFFFSGLYLIYYLFVHILFGNGCNTTPINLNKIKKTGKSVTNIIVKKGKNLEKTLITQGKKIKKI